MSVIFQLVIKHFKLNPKRTGIAIGSVMLTVMLLTILANTFVWGFQYMKEVEVYTHGSWQARYHGLTEEQAQKLKTREEFAVCSLAKISEGEGIGETWQADVELKEVNPDMFRLTQQIGKEIGMISLEEQGIMEMLPNGEQASYDIYYHMELLDFYGITEENSGLSMQAILLGIMAVIMGITALLIYSVFSLSFLEKKKYIGLLSCVGASVWQRRMFIAEEGIIIALFSIPAGVLLGSVGSVAVITLLKDTLNSTYQLAIELPVTWNMRVTVLSALLGGMTIGIGIVVPSMQAGKVSPLELIYKAGESKTNEVSGKYYSKRSVPFNLAIRNLLCNRKKTVKMILFIILTICIAFNGYIAIQDMRGVWLLCDERETKPLDAWVQIYSDDVSLEKGLKEEVRKMPWCEDVNYLNVLDMGAMIIDERYVQDDLKPCYLPWWNTSLPVRFWDERNSGGEEHYAFNIKIVGVDDETFEQYLKEYGDVDIQMKAEREGKYTVIVDNYIPIQKDGEEYAKYCNVLDIPSGEEMKIQFGTYADYELMLNNLDRGGVSEEWNQEMNLTVCHTARERLPYPVEIGAWGMVSDDYTQMESYYMRFYIPNSQFQKFLTEENMKQTYGVLHLEEKGSKNHMISYSNPILNYLCIDRAEGADEGQIQSDLQRIMAEYGLRPHHDAGEEYENDSFTWEYGNVETLNRMKIMKNAGEILRRIFMIGAILLILALTIFSLIQYIATSIYMRKREFAVLKSMGMGEQGLKKMLFYENVLLILIATTIGSAFSWWEAYTQLQAVREGAATVEIHFPFGIFFGIIAGLLFLTGGIVVVMIQRMKQVNVLEALKNYND